MTRIKKPLNLPLMKVHKNIRAFTLGEMIVVLIITGIVVGMAYTVLRLVQKQMRAIQYNYEQQLVLKKLETSLWLDSNTYHRAVYHAADSTLVFSNELDSVMYEFKTTGVIKARDTFAIPLAKKTFFFNGEQVNDARIDALKLYSSEAFQNQEIFIFKRNDANSHLKP